MVNQAKQVALNPRDNSAANKWRDVNEELLHAVRNVGDAITGSFMMHARSTYLFRSDSISTSSPSCTAC